MASASPAMGGLRLNSPGFCFGGVARVINWPSKFICGSGSEGSPDSRLFQRTAYAGNPVSRRFEPMQLKKVAQWAGIDRKSTRLNSSHLGISYAVFCLKK